MKKPTPSRFQFYGLKIDSVRPAEKPVPHIRVKASDAAKVPSCPKCGHPEVNFKGRETLRLRDAPIDGRRVIVEISHRTHQCRKCRASFVAPKPYQDGLHHFTPRLRQWVMDHSGEKRLALAAETGVCERSIKHILNGKTLPAPQGTI